MPWFLYNILIVILNLHIYFTNFTPISGWERLHYYIMRLFRVGRFVSVRRLLAFTRSKSANILVDERSLLLLHEWSSSVNYKSFA